MSLLTYALHIKNIMARIACNHPVVVDRLFTTLCVSHRIVITIAEKMKETNVRKYKITIKHLRKLLAFQSHIKNYATIAFNLVKRGTKL